MTEPSASYDVVIVGTQLGPLVAGALLAKRGFRVLLLGQDDVGATYPVGDLELPRAPFTFLPAHSPAVRRVLGELALHPLLRRRSVQVDPAFQVVLPEHRFEVPLDDALLEKEVAREFPEVRRPIADFLGRLAKHDAALDEVFARDITWPPDSFFERRELGRAAARTPFGKTGDGVELLDDLPRRHPFRLAVELPIRFSDGMDPDHGIGLRRARHFAAWRRGGAVVEGGAAGLRHLLVESLESHSGEVRPAERIDRVLVRRGTATGVRLAASGEVIGATSILVGSPVARLLAWVPDRGPFEELFERTGEPVIRYYRYTLNLILGPDGIPAAMARDVFYLRRARRSLSDENALHLQAETLEDGRRLLTVEALLPRRAVEEIPEFLASMRERIVRSLETLLPFLRSHLELVDSPHDGRDVQDLTSGKAIAPPAPWDRGPQTMEPVYGFPVPTALGVCALPVRTPVRHLYLVNRQLAPGLGLEGDFLAAASAARIVGRADRKKDWMRRGRWKKLEL